MAVILFNNIRKEDNMKVSDYIVNVLKQYGIEYVFGYQGANISHLIDSIGKSGNVKFIESYNEQGASFCANGYAQVSKKLGVAIASSGPGAINLISGITNAYFDSIPCIYITGNVGSKSMRKSNSIRQNSFQELDIISMTQDVTKYSKMIQDPLQVPMILKEAIYVALEGRKGPVHLDIPHDIQKCDIPDSYIKSLKTCENKQKGNFNKVENFAQQYLTSLKNSKRPLILIGAGFADCTNKEQGLTFLNALNIPYVASLQGLTAVNSDDDKFVGFIGDYGNRYANLAIHYCDNLLILGSRLDHRQTGGDLSKFAPKAKIYRVEIDENEVNRVAIDSYTLLADIRGFLEFFQGKVLKKSFAQWTSVINRWKIEFSSFDATKKDVHVNTFFDTISKSLEDAYIVCGDVGQNQMAIAQSFRINEKGSLLMSGGLGAMGYAIPASLGAKYASKDSLVIAVVGDGGIQMNIQELQMIQRDSLNIKIILVNNNCLGMIRQYQSLALESKFYGSVIGFKNPNYSKIADAYGLEYFRVVRPESYIKCLDFIHSDKACLIEVGIGEDINLIPEMGKNIIEQFPAFDDEKMQKIERQVNLL